LKIVQFRKSVQIRKTKKNENEKQNRKQKPETDENRASNTKTGLKRFLKPEKARNRGTPTGPAHLEESD
jgi:hypothetical protein